MLFSIFLSKNRFIYYFLLLWIAALSTGCSKFGALKYRADVLPASALAISFAAFVTAGTCYDVTISAVDSNGRSKPVSNEHPLTVSGEGNLQFFSDSNCATQLTSVRGVNGLRMAINPSISAVLSRSASKQIIYFKASSTSSVRIRVTDNSGNLKSAESELKFDSGVATQIALSGKSSISAGFCEAYTVSAKDGSNNVALLANAVTLTLTGAGAGNFYSDPNCVTVASSLTLAANSSTGVTYYKNNAAASVTLTLTNGTGTFSPLSMAVSVLPNNVLITGNASFVAGTCQAYTLTLADALNVPSSIPFNITLSLTGAASGGYFSNPLCTSAITSVVLTSGSTSTTIYYKNNTAQPVTLNVDNGAGGLTPGTKGVTVTPGTPSVVIITGPSTVAAGNCSTAFTVTTKDSLGNDSAVASNLAVTLSGGGSGSFYSDSGCSSPAAPFVVASATFANTFFIKDNTAEVLTLNAAAVSFTAGTKPFTVSPGAPSKIIFVGPISATAGSCSTAFVATIRDQLDNPAPVISGSTTVTLSGLGAGGLFTDVGCNTSAGTSLVYTAGQSAKTIYYRNNVAGSITLAAASGGLTTGTAGVTINPGTSNTLAISGSATVTAGICSGAYTITTSDALGNTAAVTGNITVDLSGNRSGAFYSDSGCSSSTTSVVVGTGTSTQTFYFLDNTAEAPTFYAASASFTTGTRGVTVNPAPADRLFLTGPATLTAGVCGTVYTVTSRDQFGNASSLGTNTTITFSGEVAGSFYTGNTCTGATSTGTITAGTSAVAFYFKNDTAQPLTLNASATGLTATALGVTVNPGAPTKFLVTGPGTLSAGACSAIYTVTSTDSLNNASAVASQTTVNLLGGSGAYYSDAGCTSSVVTVDIAAAGSTRTFYYSSNSAETFTITAGAAGFSNGTKGVTVNPAPPTVVTLTGPTSLAAGGCSAAFTVTSRDIFANASTVSGDNLVVLTGNGAGSFYSDAGCLNTTSDVTIANGTSTKTVFFKDNSVELLTLVANGGGLGIANLGVAINPSKILLSGAFSSSAGACLPLTVNTTDANNIPANVPANLIVTPSVTTGSGSFFSDSGCLSTQTTFTIGSGTTGVTFYMRDTVAESFTIQANAPGMATSSLAHTVNPAAPAQITQSGPASVVAGVCSAVFTITSKDTHGNISAVTGDTAVNFSGGGAGAFYLDSSCSTSTTSVSLLNGASQTTFYFSSNTAEGLTLVSNGSGLSTVNHPFTVNAANPTVLTMAGPATVIAGACSTAITIRTRDNFNNFSNVGSGTTITFTGAGTGGFFSDVSCSTPSPTLIIAGGSSTQTAYYRNTTAASVSTGITGVGLSAGSLNMTVEPGPPSLLTLSGPSSLTAGVCGTVYTVTVRDSNNNVTNATANLTVNLSGKGTGSFNSDSSCDIGLSPENKTISTGQSTAQFFFKDTKAEALTLQASATGLTAGTQAVTVNPAAVNKLVMTGPGSVSAGSCATYTVTSQDFFNNVSNVTSNTTVNLSGNGSGSFYSNNGCTSATNSKVLASGTSATVIYFKDTVGENLTLRATASGLNQASLGVTVLSPALLTISAGPVYDYGEKPSGSLNDKTFTVSNSGGQAATSVAAGTPALSAPFSFKGGSYPGGGTCGSSISAMGGSCTIIITFAPTGIAASSTGVSFNDTIRIGYSDGVANQIANRQVEGTGTPTSGNLDLNFNFTGKKVTSLGSNSDVIRALAVDAADRIVAVGSADGGGDNRVAVGRYLADGTLDASFGSGGTVITDMNTGNSAIAVLNAVGLPSTTEILAGGYTAGSGVDEFLLVGYNASDGSSFTTLGGTGKVTTAVGTNDSRANSLVIQSNNQKAVLGGYAYNGTDYDFAMVRYEADGTLDSTFNSTGIKTLDFAGSNDAIRSLIERPSDNYFIATGYTEPTAGNKNFALSRFSSAGVIDNTFGTSGMKVTDFLGGDDEIYAAALDASGSVVVAGYSSNANNTVTYFTLARYLNSGSLDASFNSTGKLTLTLGSGNSYARAVSVQSDGKIVAAGYSVVSGNEHFTLVRVNANGTLDTTFGTNGVVNETVSVTFFDRIMAMVLQPNGRIVTGGFSNNGGGDDNFAIARFWP